MQKRGEVGWLVGEKGKTRAAGKSRKQRERGWFLLFITIVSGGCQEAFFPFPFFLFCQKKSRKNRPLLFCSAEQKMWRQE